MKLLSKDEIKSNKEKELARDVSRTETVRTALKQSQEDLDDTNARFEVALANQRVRWAREEEEAGQRISLLRSEIKDLEERRNRALLPIEDLEKKAQNLFKEAEVVLAEARDKKHKVEQAIQATDEMEDILDERLDEVSEREIEVTKRLEVIQIGEKNLQHQKELIKELSKELSIKLSEL